MPHPRIVDLFVNLSDFIVLLTWVENIVLIFQGQVEATLDYIWYWLGIVAEKRVGNSVNRG